MKLVFMALFALGMTACNAREESFQCPNSPEEIKSLVEQNFHWKKSDPQRSKRDAAKSPYGDIYFLKPPSSTDSPEESTMIGTLIATRKDENIKERYFYFFNCKKNIMEFSGPLPIEDK